eukprot:RCo033430
MDKFVQVSGPDSAAKPNPKWSNGMKALIPSFEALRGQSAGISDGMRQHCGEVGVVAEIGSSGRCRVSFSDGSQFWYDPDRLLVPEESEKGTAPMAKASVSRKTLKDFPSEKEYEAYLKAVLKTGTKLVAVSGDRKGDRGTYLGTNSFQPPCHVQWEKLGKAYWVHWRDVELDDGTPVQEDAPKPVTKLESGQWYRWTGGPERPGNWNNEGMDFVLDGKPHQVKESSGQNASFFDSPKPDSKWYFGHVMDKFVQVSGPDSAAKEDAPKPVTKLESGQWYRWTGGPERPGNWNNEGMDFVLDGKPHQVKESSGQNASFFDSPKPDSKWYFGHVMDKFVQASAPESAAKEDAPKRVTKLESGQWYRWTGSTTRPGGWNGEGKMDFLLDGKPHQ